MGTLLSRVTGLGRVVAMGIVLGQTLFTDQFNNANTSPNMIYALLLATRERIAHGERNYPLIEAQAKVQLLEQGLRPDYFSIRCARTLEPASLSDTKLVILVAAWLGKTRLIDNVAI